MDVTCDYINYADTDFFPKLITDYISGAESLKPFYNLPADIDGIKRAIINRKAFSTNRHSLVEHLNYQYANITTHEQVKNNISKLSDNNTFTVTTAHQPNIFTGHLYFIYKIIHTIKLADSLNKDLPQYNFVPVFYMGNEDADLEELGHIYINGIKYNWNTGQTGAVGKMLVDDELILLIKKFTGQLEVLPFGPSIVEILKKCYLKGITLQEATLRFVNELFGEYGLVILIPDSAILKQLMAPVFKDDLINNNPFKIVTKTNEQLEKTYKYQAEPRPINLFYLDDQVRNRIIKQQDEFIVENTIIKFSETSLKETIENNPEKFSPNVILRGLYQETILPNLAFIGGSGEISYWFQLKNLFEYYAVPYPVLILRNSFLIADKKTKQLQQKLNISNNSIFHSSVELINQLVKTISTNSLSVENEKEEMHVLYASLNERVKHIDATLVKHVLSLEQKALEKLISLEKKMLRAEKRKFSEQQQQIMKLKSTLFPNNSLQERVENILPFYSKWGPDLFNVLYNKSLIFEQQFCFISEN